MIDIEKQILFERGDCWVTKKGDLYHVMKNGTTHATSLFAFCDLSIAILYCGESAKQPMRARESLHHAEEIL